MILDFFKEFKRAALHIETRNPITAFGVLLLRFFVFIIYSVYICIYKFISRHFINYRPFEDTLFLYGTDLLMFLIFPYLFLPYYLLRFLFFLYFILRCLIYILILSICEYIFLFKGNFHRALKRFVYKIDTHFNEFEGWYIASKGIFYINSFQVFYVWVYFFLITYLWDQIIKPLALDLGLLFINLIFDILDIILAIISFLFFGFLERLDTIVFLIIDGTWEYRWFYTKLYFKRKWRRFSFYIVFSVKTIWINIYYYTGFFFLSIYSIWCMCIKYPRRFLRIYVMSFLDLLSRPRLYFIWYGPILNTLIFCFQFLKYYFYRVFWPVIFIFKYTWSVFINLLCVIYLYLPTRLQDFIYCCVLHLLILYYGVCLFPLLCYKYSLFFFHYLTFFLQYIVNLVIFCSLKLLNFFNFIKFVFWLIRTKPKSFFALLFSDLRTIKHILIYYITTKKSLIINYWKIFKAFF